jgi:hypothetical protein
MKLTSKTVQTYVPKSYKNRELPESEQITCILDHPNSEQFEKYAASMTKSFDGIGIVKDRVKSIKNLEVDGLQILTGEDLLKKAKRADVSELVSELIYAFLNGAGITEEQEKNFEALPS